MLFIAFPSIFFNLSGGVILLELDSSDFAWIHPSEAAALGTAPDITSYSGVAVSPPG